LKISRIVEGHKGSPPWAPWSQATGFKPRFKPSSSTSNAKGAGLSAMRLPDGCASEKNSACGVHPVKWLDVCHTCTQGCTGPRHMRVSSRRQRLCPRQKVKSSRRLAKVKSRRCRVSTERAEPRPGKSASSSSSSSIDHLVDSLYP
jgi:hypothetical protein